MSERASLVFVLFYSKIREGGGIRFVIFGFELELELELIPTRMMQTCRLNFWVLDLLVKNTTPLYQRGGHKNKFGRSECAHVRSAQVKSRALPIRGVAE